MKQWTALLPLAACCLLAGVAVPAQIKNPELPTSNLVTESYWIPSDTPGIKLFIRNKHPRSLKTFSAAHTLLYVHGSTYPSETAFDLKLNGFSWMDYIASRGYDVYLVDLRGYGQSTRPPEMDQPADKNPPIVRTDTAVRDVSAAVEHILARRHIAKLDLLGWSWGTTIMGSYTAQHNDKVNRLVLYAPQWLRTTPSLVSGGPGQLGAYRTVSREAAKDRWLTGVPADKKADLIPAGWFEAWADATFATDPVGSKQNPPTLRAPNGTVIDTQEYWTAGKPLYDPSQITAPVLLVHAEWDADLPSYMAHAYYTKLTRAPYKRFVEISEGTHTIIMEKNRIQLFREVQLFLDEATPVAGQ